MTVHGKNWRPYEGGTSPWGFIDSVTPLGDDGAAFVTTPGHGGIFLPPALAARMPNDIVAGSFLGLAAWWEEDCDAAWPTVVLKLGTEDAQARALTFLASYKPDLLIGWELAVELNARSAK